MRAVVGGWTPGRGWDPAVVGVDARDPVLDARTLVLVFAETDEATARSAVAELERARPGAIIVGCSTAGAILSDELSEYPVVAAIVEFAEVEVSLAWLDVSDAGSSLATGEELGRRLAGHLTPGWTSAVLVLADGLVVNGTALVDGFSRSLPDDVTISGGLAGDGDRFADTWVYAEGEFRRGAVVAVALSGPGLEVGYGSAGGWEGFGPYRTVTGSQGSVLHTLDDRPALALYREYLGDRADQLPASALLFPLLIRSPDSTVELVRTVLGIDDVNSTMTFAGDIPEGWTARLMRTTLDRLVDASALAAEACQRELTEPELAIAVSCVGRRLVLGQRTDEELEAAVDVLGRQAPLIGFYSYGELSPGSGSCELHNQTMTLTTLREKAST